MVRHGLDIAATHFGWDEFLNDLDRVIDTVAPALAETFAKVHAAGYSGVQVSACRSKTWRASEHGLEIAATHFGWDEFLTELDR